MSRAEREKELDRIMKMLFEAVNARHEAGDCKDDCPTSEGVDDVHILKQLVIDENCDSAILRVGGNLHQQMAYVRFEGDKGGIHIPLREKDFARFLLNLKDMEVFLGWGEK